MYYSVSLFEIQKLVEINVYLRQIMAVTLNVDVDVKLFHHINVVI